MSPSRLRRTSLAIVALVAVAVLSASCGGGSSGGSKGSSTSVDVPSSKFDDQTGKRSVDITATDNEFGPVYVTITAGTKVTWDNAGRNAHNVVPVEQDAFKGVVTSDFGPGQDYTTTFDKAGDYPYYCSLHGTKNLNGMSGVIRVVSK
jgi:plastocyanin